jgi:hypothetical protein
MLADLDLLLIAIAGFCAADDLLPEARNNARPMLTDAEVVTLCVAQAITGIASDHRFARVAGKQLRDLFPGSVAQRLSDMIERLIDQLARMSPGYHDPLLLVDSTPVECARSRETVKRGGNHSLPDALTDAADDGYRASHSRLFYGFRLHALFAPDGTPRALELTPPKVDEREVALPMLARIHRHGPVTVIGDKGCASRAFEDSLTDLGARILRP